MATLSPKDRAYLQDLFGRELKAPVKMVFYTQSQSPLTVPGQECRYCQDERELLEQLITLSDQLTLEIHDFVAESELARSQGIERIPALELVGKVQGRVRYFGIPSGYEFASLIEDLVDASRGDTKLSAATRAQVAALPNPVHIQVFGTPT